MADGNRDERQFMRQVRRHLLPKYRNFLETAEQESLEAEVLLGDALKARATDLHLDPFGDHYRIRLRIDGLMLDALEISREQAVLLINQLKALAGLDPLTLRYLPRRKLSLSP